MLLLPRARAAEARGGDNASQLAEFVEQTPDAVVITDSVGRVLMANPAFQSMCVGGPAEHPLKGRLLTDLLGDPGHRLSGLVAEPRPLLACTQVAGGAARAGCGWLHRVPDQGVLAVKLCTRRPDHLMGLRKERLLTVTWAGDPAKPMVNNDPLQSRLALVCRLVRDRARHRVALERCRAGAGPGHWRVAGADRRRGAGLYRAAGLSGRAGRDAPAPPRLACRAGAGAPRCAGPGPGAPVPMGVRAEAVPGRDGQRLATIIVLADLSDSRRADQARHPLEQSLQQAGQGGRSAHDSARADPLIGAILSNASLAAMDIADSAAGPTVAPLLEEVEASAQRATALYARSRQLSGA